MARVVASKVGDVAQANVRRVGLSIAAVVLVTLAVAFLLVAAYDVLSARFAGWAAAMIVAGATVVCAGLCLWGAVTSPSMSDTLMPHADERGEDS